jgi:signal transduction histidine kinase
MLTKHFALIAGVFPEIGADRLARDGPEAVQAESHPTPKKAAMHRGLPVISERQSRLERDIRMEECSRERARILHELHDTLFQGFLAASMLVYQAVEQTPSDSPSKPVLSRALRLVRQAIDEGRAAIRAIQTASPAPCSLEQAFSNLLEEDIPGRGVRLFVQGKPWELSPTIQEQVFLIGREAVMNALRHSNATNIEVELQYTRRLLRLFIRDNGCGIDPDVVQERRDSHWGLCGMRERANNIDAQFEIWSRRGAGTEVHVTVRVASRFALA